MASPQIWGVSEAMSAIRVPPYAQGKHRSATRCHAPGRRPDPGSAAHGPERASRLRRGSLALILDLCLLFIHPPAHGSEVSPAVRNTLDSARIPRASKLLICGLFQKGRVLAQDGVEPICRMLPIAPSTYYEQKAREKDPSRQRCFRHQVLLRGCRQWYRCGRDRVARPAEHENLDPRPQRNRRRQEDVSKGEPSASSDQPA